MAIKWPWRSSSKHIEQLKDLLGNQSNVESFLGVKDPVIPDQERIRVDAAKIVHYSRSGDYKIFADEIWSRVLSHLDVMMDEKASKERVDYHRGAIKEALDLLRLSYQARSLVKAESEREQSASLQR
jgi:hypothetical protein